MMCLFKRLGWAGLACDTCASNYYGPSCQKCECDPTTSVCFDGIEGTGKCGCLEGHKGDKCEDKISKDDVTPEAAGGIGAVLGIVFGLVVAAVAVYFIVRSKYFVNWMAKTKAYVWTKLT
jgi:hypothetical protein